MAQTVSPIQAGAECNFPFAVPADATNLNAPASNTAAVVTLAADADRPNILSQIFYSYDGAPTAGSIKVEDVSGTTVFQQSITAGGPGRIDFNPPIQNAVKNSALIVTLAAGGSGVTGKLVVNAYKLQ